MLKASRRDLAYAVTARKTAATTVAATMYLAHKAGVRLFATGGIGGAHRPPADVWDISADLIELVLPMEAKLIESNPLVEETRNQVAVKRGPVVYCLESVDLPAGQKVLNVALPAGIDLKPEMITVEGSPIMSLQGTARLMGDANWTNQLYREIQKDSRTVPVRLVPYYAWGNRGHAEMSVWMPVSR